MGNIGRLPGPAAKLGLLIIRKRFHEFSLGIHYKRPLLGNGLVNTHLTYPSISAVPVWRSKLLLQQFP